MLCIKMMPLKIKELLYGKVKHNLNVRLPSLEEVKEADIVRGIEPMYFCYLNIIRDCYNLDEYVGNFLLTEKNILLKTKKQVKGLNTIIASIDCLNSEHDFDGLYGSNREVMILDKETGFTRTKWVEKNPYVKIKFENGNKAFIVGKKRKLRLQNILSEEELIYKVGDLKPTEKFVEVVRYY